MLPLIVFLGRMTYLPWPRYSKCGLWEFVRHAESQDSQILQMY